VSSAIRFVLDGEGAYTAVEGEKANMSRGDFILTPNWAPHDHGNPSEQADAVARRARHADDQPLRDVVHGALRREGAEHQREDGDSLERFGSGVLPDGQTVDTFKHKSPVINYTYARTRPICERLLNTGDVDPRTARGCATPTR
jgi:gentisate 1,2-dioxygenase